MDDSLLIAAIRYHSHSDETLQKKSRKRETAENGSLRHDLYFHLYILKRRLGVLSNSE
jgi:hypothetical protein